MEQKRETRSFLMPRDPSIDRRFRPRPNKRERLFCEITEETIDDVGDTSDDEDFDMQSVATEEPTTAETGALVYLRLKPVENPSKAYSIAGNVLMNVPPTDSASSSKNKNCMEKHYVFSEIFDQEVSQREVYEQCIGEKIRAEESFTVLTYGTSGSGKTFTLLGNDQYPGIIPRSLENIFSLYKTNLYPTPIMKLVNARVTVFDDAKATDEQITSLHLIDQCKSMETNHTILQQSIQNEHNFEALALNHDVSVLIWVTFVEIYNECVYDLLAPYKKASGGGAGAAAINSRKNLKIVCNAGKVFIKGVTSVYVKSSLDALKLLRAGLQKLTYASTAINANSSRSHCVFFIDVLKYYRSGVIAETSYKFCDLAGSERLDKTGNMGSRLKEAQRINTSLMVLGRCLDAANNITTAASSTSSLTSSKKELIPYRESKLTMILQAALQGKEKLAMIVNVTPSDKYFEENLNVLSFASIASNIIFKAPVIKPKQSRYSAFGITPDNNYIQELLEENSRLKADMETLKEQHNLQLEELIDENYDLKEEIQRLTYQHQEELLKQEHDLRNKLVDEYQKSREEHKKQFKRRLELELERQKRSHMYEMEQLKRRHQEELEDLREELGGDDDDDDDDDNDNDVNKSKHNINEDTLEKQLFNQQNAEDAVIIKKEEKENMPQNI